LCNTVHPSVGNKLAYTTPPLQHETKTHIIQYYCGFPSYIETRDGSVVEDKTVGFATARGVIVAMRVLLLCLDGALRVIDDIGLTSGSPELCKEKSWRRLPTLGRNELCPCRSGLKTKACGHKWGDSAPSVPIKFEHFSFYAPKDNP